MNYNKILRELSKKEKISKKEVEFEMQKALNISHLNCSAEEFIENTTKIILERLYIV